MIPPGSEDVKMIILETGPQAFRNTLVYERDRVPGIAVGFNRADVEAAYGQPYYCQDHAIPGDFAFRALPVSGGGLVSVRYRGLGSAYRGEPAHTPLSRSGSGRITQRKFSPAVNPQQTPWDMRPADRLAMSIGQLRWQRLQSPHRDAYLDLVRENSEAFFGPTIEILDVIEGGDRFAARYLVDGNPACDCIYVRNGARQFKDDCMGHAASRWRTARGGPDQTPISMYVLAILLSGTR